MWTEIEAFNFMIQKHFWELNIHRPSVFYLVGVWPQSFYTITEIHIWATCIDEAAVRKQWMWPGIRHPYQDIPISFSSDGKNL